MKKLFIILTFATVGCQQGGAPLTSADIDAIKKIAERLCSSHKHAVSPISEMGYADDVISMPPHAPQCWETKDHRVSLSPRAEDKFVHC